MKRTSSFVVRDASSYLALIPKPGASDAVGATTPRGQMLPPGMIWVDAGEIGVEGPGYVQNVEPCAAIQPGPGRVVMATVSHPSSEIYSLKLRSGGEAAPAARGQALKAWMQGAVFAFGLLVSSMNGTAAAEAAEPVSPPWARAASDEQILTTGQHPFWSETRQQWVGAKDLVEGEQLVTATGQPAFVSAQALLGGRLPVFNLEVEQEHVYFVGEDGVLVHNSYTSAANNAPARISNTTRTGTVRTNPADWRATRDLWDEVGYGEVLSDANRARIAAGRTPVVDDAWIAIHPEDAGLVGERISMHHVQGLPITVPLPASRHLDAHMPGGYRYNPGGPGSQLPIYPATPPSTNP